MELSDLRLSKIMKYTSLYNSMRFYEHTQDVFEKYYDDGTYIKIESNTQKVYINDKLAFELTHHESFVKLECINRLLSLGFFLSDFSLIEGQYEMIFKGYQISFIVWEKEFTDYSLKNKTVIYKSRLISGVLEYKCKIKDNGIFDYGLFENKTSIIRLKKQVSTSYNEHDFVIKENRVMKYIGKSNKVIVPEGIEELESSSFWDNQYVEEVLLPHSLKNMGGDTFYNCKKLRRINIPTSVVLMGNNPFAGCPMIEINNYSEAFIYENGALYTSDKTTLIYCAIKGEENEFVIPEGVNVICKHAFFMCDRFIKITLPSTLKKMENNPFSGCTQLEIINHSKNYFIKDDIIYNGFKTSVVGTLNKIKSENLMLLDGIKTINRNSFWNCKGIKKIVLPESLIDIGYNPFVGCSNIHFESKSPFFKVSDDVLYNKDYSKIICYPPWKAKGSIALRESVLALERGAFSGCSNMTNLRLHNVNIINKSCFTNCYSLKKLYCSDLISYIGEWAFAYCHSLKEVSVAKNTIIDNNVFSNCLANLTIRKIPSNYLFESDNIYTLESMQKAYKEKIDSILIDPPYNSHIDYIGYKDNSNLDVYHSFMSKRIGLSYELLSDKGFLVINIDENELTSLVNICKKYFHNELVKIYKWIKKHEFFDKNRVILNSNKVQTDYEYIIICKKTSKAIFSKLMQPYIEDGALKEKESLAPEEFDCFGTTSSAKDEINELFGKRDYFSTPKPLKLMKELIRATTNKNSIILDYFAGSGTVGHACLDLNKEDGGHRTFILVCNKESNICKKVTKKRLEIATSKLGGSFVFIR